MKKLSIDDIRRIGKKNDFELLSNKYINLHTKMLWRCKKGHTFEMEPNNVRYGQGCSECVGKKKITIQLIESLIREKGGTLLEYQQPIHSKSKITVRCCREHVWSPSVAKLLLGRWCHICGKAQKYSDEELIKLIMELHIKLGKIPTYYDWPRIYPDWTTITRRFGSWENALKQAGITKRATRQECIKALQELAEKIGSSPSRSTYQSLLSFPSASYISKLFGSWNNAKKDAKLEERKCSYFSEMWKVWELLCEETVNEIFKGNLIIFQYSYTKSNRTVDIYIPSLRLAIDAKLSSYYIENTSENQINAMINSDKFDEIQFWCLDKGHYEHPKVKYLYAKDLIDKLNNIDSVISNQLASKINKTINRDEDIKEQAGLTNKRSLIKDIVDFYSSNNRYPSQREITKNNGFKRSVSSYVNNFGSLTKALMEAGMPPPRTYWRTLSNEELKIIFFEFINCEFNGRIPKAHELKYYSQYPNLGVYTKRFGTYNKWLEYCELNIRNFINKSKNITKENALQILKDAFKNSGKYLVGKNNNFHRYVDWAPSYNWYRKHFGSWNNALILAGIPVIQETKNYKITKLELLDNLICLESELGRELTIKDINRKDLGISISRILKLFKSFKNAKQRMEKRKNNNTMSSDVRIK